METWDAPCTRGRVKKRAIAAYGSVTGREVRRPPGAGGPAVNRTVKWSTSVSEEVEGGPSWGQGEPRESPEGRCNGDKDL